MRRAILHEHCDCGSVESMAEAREFVTDEGALDEFVRLREKYLKRAALRIDDNEDRYYVLHGPSGHVIGWTDGV